MNDSELTPTENYKNMGLDDAVFFTCTKEHVYMEFVAPIKAIALTVDEARHLAGQLRLYANDITRTKESRFASDTTTKDSS